MLPAEQCGCVEGRTQNAYQTSTEAKGGKFFMSNVIYTPCRHICVHFSVMVESFTHVDIQCVLGTFGTGMTFSKIDWRCILS